MAQRAANHHTMPNTAHHPIPPVAIAATVAAGTLWQRLRAVLPWLKGERQWLWTVGIAATVIGGSTEWVVSYFLKVLLDSGFQDQTLNPLWVPLLLLLLVLLRSGLSFLGESSIALLASDGVYRLRQHLFAHLQNVQLGLFQKESASSLSNTLVYEVQNGTQMLVHTLLETLRNAATVLGLLAYLLWLNWLLSLIVFLVFPLVALVSRTVSRRLYRLTQNTQAATDALAYTVEENVLAHRVLRLQLGQEQQQARFARDSHLLRRLSIKAAMAGATASPVNQILITLALAAVVAIALYQSRTQGLSVGSFASFVAAMMLMVDPLKSLSRALTPITRGLAALERGLLFLQQWPLERGGQHRSGTVQGRIRYRNVSVHYAAPASAPAPAPAPSSAPAALQGLNLDIAAGELVALIGPSGSGKTTLAHLLPRFVAASAGQVLLDDVALEDWDLAALRANIALVSQDVVLINASVLTNVTLGDAQPDRTRALQCLHIAHLGELLQQLPAGIDSIVGHNAGQLSGGQRQRLSIARALYKNAPILILDEATSALDNESERLVQAALRTLMQGRTTLVIAHRLSTIEHADRIVVLEAGRIVEQGQHQYLLAQRGRYFRLWQRGFSAPTP